MMISSGTTHPGNAQQGIGIASSIHKQNIILRRNAWNPWKTTYAILSHPAMSPIAAAGVIAENKQDNVFTSSIPPLLVDFDAIREAHREEPDGQKNLSPLRAIDPTVRQCTSITGTKEKYAEDPTNSPQAAVAVAEYEGSAFMDQERDRADGDDGTSSIMESSIQDKSDDHNDDDSLSIVLSLPPNEWYVGFDEVSVLTMDSSFGPRFFSDEEDGADNFTGMTIFFSKNQDGADESCASSNDRNSTTPTGETVTAPELSTVTQRAVDDPQLVNFLVDLCS